MDRISQLSDELLLKILSLLPTANEVVATMVLSKRWEFLWKMVPKLVYDDSYKNIEYARFSGFVDRSLCLHEAPVLETLHFKLGETCGPDDIQVWIRAADKRCLRELILESNISSRASQFILPRSFYTVCRMLVTLNLSSAILADVSSPISFPFLKKLHILSMKYPGDEFLKRFLSNCPVLEDLVFEQCRDDNVSICNLRVPFLKTLSVCKKENRDDANGFVINTPSLVSLMITDYTNGFCVSESEMPKIVTVDVDISRSNLGKILGFVTSVKHLYLCLATAEMLHLDANARDVVRLVFFDLHLDAASRCTSQISRNLRCYRMEHLDAASASQNFLNQDAYPVGSVFHQLVSLTLCRCDKHWLNLLMRLLKDSPKLRALKLDQDHGLQAHDPSPFWTEPSAVPDCLLLSLETLEWENYEGAEEEKELVEYILRNGVCLKKVTISSKSTDNDKKLEMLKGLNNVVQAFTQLSAFI